MLNVKIDCDTFLTQIAHILYRLMARNLRSYENSDTETLNKEFVQGWGRVYNYEYKIIVCLNKKRATGCLINAQLLDMRNVVGTMIVKSEYQTTIKSRTSNH